MFNIVSRVARAFAADNGGNACVAVDFDQHGMWKSTNCSIKAYSICETTRDGQTRPTVTPTNSGQGSCATGWTPIGSQYCFYVSL
jgi:hypothetical protein